jgi:hypothetical protein
MPQQVGRMTRTIYLRTAPELHEWLVEQAKENRRSVNAQVEFMLMQARKASEGEQPAKPPKKPRR